MKQINVRALRTKLGLNQTDFWGAVYVTQSGGSRYEINGRHMPDTVRALVGIAYLGETLECIKNKPQKPGRA